MPYLVLDPSTATVIPDPAPNPAAPSAIGVSLSAARDELRAMLVGRSDITDPRLDFWLNRAYIDLATSAKKLDELRYSLEFNTVIDQPLYMLPTLVSTTMTVSRVDATVESGGVPLDKIDLPNYRRRKDTSVSPRKPRAFLRMDRLLILEPTPDDEYPIILDFRFVPAELVLDADCPVFNTEWHESWILLARKKALSSLSEWEASMAAGNDFAGNVRARQDREVNEEENRVVSSSVPRTRRQLIRRGQRLDHPLRDN